MNQISKLCLLQDNCQSLHDIKERLRLHYNMQTGKGRSPQAVSIAPSPVFYYIIEGPPFLMHNELLCITLCLSHDQNLPET